MSSHANINKSLLIYLLTNKSLWQKCQPVPYRRNDTLVEIKPVIHGGLLTLTYYVNAILVKINAAFMSHFYPKTTAVFYGTKPI